MKGLDKISDHKDLLYTNIGNNYVRKGDSEKAIENFTKAILENSMNTAALRNRAGEYLRIKNYDKALADYKLYLTLEPNAYQKDNIETVISLLQNKLDEIALKKLEEERKRLAEEERQKELLSRVLDSLSNASEDTTNLSAGTGKVEQYTDNFDIVE